MTKGKMKCILLDQSILKTDDLLSILAKMNAALPEEGYIYVIPGTDIRNAEKAKNETVYTRKIQDRYKQIKSAYSIRTMPRYCGIAEAVLKLSTDSDEIRIFGAADEDIFRISKRKCMNRVAIYDSQFRAVPFSEYYNAAKKMNPIYPHYKSQKVPVQKVQCQIAKLPLRANDILTDEEGNQYHLSGKLSGGTQGVVYKTKENCIAKFYKNECDCTSEQNTKILYLARILNHSKLLKKHCVIPRPLYLNQKFVGCVMPFEEGKVLTDLEFSPYNWMKTNDATNKALFRIAYQMSVVLAEIHRMRIMLPDLKCSNLILNQEGIVRFIDMDGAALSGWNCQMPRPEYRLTNRDFSDQIIYQQDLETEHSVFHAILFHILFNIDIRKAFNEEKTLCIPKGFCEYAYNATPLPLRNILLNKVQDNSRLFPSAEEFRDTLKKAIEEPGSIDYVNQPVCKREQNGIPVKQAAELKEETVCNSPNNVRQSISLDKVKKYKWYILASLGVLTAMVILIFAVGAK